MPVPKHFKFTVRGTFDQAPETWVTGFHMSRIVPGAGDGDLGDIDESGVTDAVVGFFASNVFAGELHVTDWRAYAIGTDGTMEGNEPLLHDFGTSGPTGTGAAWKYPPQVACVVSLIASNKGPAKYGRMYLPAVNNALAAGGRLSAVNAAAIREATTTFLKNVSDHVNLATLAQCAGVNVSKGPAGSSTGTIQEIDHLEVGLALDTMRSRRNKLLEDYAVGGHIDW